MDFTAAIAPYLPLLPALLAPIVAWALGRSRISKEAATIDYLNKRLDVLERLNRLNTQLTEGPIRPFLEPEIEYCQAFLREPPAFIQERAGVKLPAHLSLLGRFFLTQPSASPRKRVFKGLFYLFFAFALLMLTTPLYIPAELSSLASTLGAFAFYLILALLCRRAAR